MHYRKDCVMSCLSILGLNYDIVWTEKDDNFRIIESLFKDKEADIFLLPEMFSTGFCMDAQLIADRHQETLQWMVAYAKKKNVAVAGSVSVSENGQFFNRFYFVEPSGDYQFYDKRHLFSYSGEDKIYTPGKKKVIVTYKGFRILLQVCYDLRFPVFSRNDGDYDVALYVANWPKARVDAWKTLLKARSIENQSFVFGLNRIGIDGNNLEYEESSDCYFPDGKIISAKDGNFVKADLNYEELQSFRNKFQFLSDADTFHINY